MTPEAVIISFIGPVGVGVGFLVAADVEFIRACAAVPGFGAAAVVGFFADDVGRLMALWARLAAGVVAVGVSKVFVGAPGIAVLALLIPFGITAPLAIAVSLTNLARFSCVRRWTSGTSFGPAACAAPICAAPSIIFSSCSGLGRPFISPP